MSVVMLKTITPCKGYRVRGQLTYLGVVWFAYKKSLCTLRLELEVTMTYDAYISFISLGF